MAQNARALGLVESAKHLREALCDRKDYAGFLASRGGLSLSLQAGLSNVSNACILACDARFALQPRSQGVFHFCKMDIDWDDLRLFDAGAPAAVSRRDADPVSLTRRSAAS
ncbi:hypothetical protein [Mesorhizobium sp. f-mel]